MLTTYGNKVHVQVQVQVQVQDVALLIYAWCLKFHSELMGRQN